RDHRGIRVRRGEGAAATPAVLAAGRTEKQHRNETQAHDRLAASHRSAPFVVADAIRSASRRLAVTQLGWRTMRHLGPTGRRDWCQHAASTESWSYASGSP